MIRLIFLNEGFIVLFYTFEMYEFGLLSIPVKSISFILKVAVSTIGKIN